MWHLFYESSYFTLKSIEVTGNQELTALEIQKLTQLDYGMLIFNIDFHKLEERVKKTPWIKEVKSMQVSPTAIRVQVMERSALWMFSSRGKVYGLAEDGVVLPSRKLKQDSVMEIEMDASEKKRFVLEKERFTKILEWYKYLHNSIFSDFKNLRFDLSGKIEFTWNRANILVDSLEIFLRHEKKILTFFEKMKKEEEEVEYIDVRNEDMVVKLG
jgi:cell division septal protein FtsQ